MEQNSTKKKKHGGEDRFFRNSVIFSFLMRISDAIVSAFRGSRIGGAFLSYDALEEKGNQSVLLGAFRRLFGLNGQGARVKRRIAAVIENSLFCRLMNRISAALCGAYLSVYGMFLVSYGGYTLLSAIVRSVALRETGLSLLYFLIPFVCLPLSVFFFASGKRRLGSLLAEGRISSFFLFSVFGLRRENFIGKQTSGGRKNLAFMLGMLLGVSTYFVSPIWSILFPVGLLAVWVVMASPEAGLIVTFFLLPLLIYSGHPSVLLAAMVLLIFFSFLVKAMRGKRYVRFETVDLFFLLFALVFLLGAFFGFGGKISNALPLYLVLMLGYFLSANLLVSRVWLRRGVAAMLAGGAVSSLYGIYQYITGNVDTVWLDTENFSNIAGRSVSFFENPNMLGEYVMMLLPLALCMALTSRRSRRGSWLCVFAATFLCLIFSWARGAWLGAIAALFLFCIFYSKRSIPFLLLLLFCVPLLPAVLPSSIVGRLTSIGDMTDSSTSYRYYIWKSSLDMIRDFGLFGIGVGNENFSPVYVSYAYSGIESSPHSHNLFFQIAIETGIAGILTFLSAMFVYFQSGLSAFVREKDPFLRTLSLAAMCGVFASLVQGMTDYVWYNYRVFFVFFALIGIGVAARRCGEDLRAREEKPCYMTSSSAEITFCPEEGGEREEIHE